LTTLTPGLAVAVCGIVVVLSLSNVGNLYEQTKARAAFGDPYGVLVQSARLQAAISSMPPNGAAGYLNEPDPDAFTGAKKLLGAQYAFAPRMLVPQTQSPQQLVIGDFSRPVDLAEFARLYGLRVVRDFGNGIVLFQRNGRQ
jgi:hypothetical protein